MKLNIGFSEVKDNWRNVLRGRRLPFKLGVIATLAIAIGANIAVLGNLGVFFGPTVPGATHRHFFEPWLQLSANKAMDPTQIGIFRPIYDELAESLKGRAETALYQLNSGTLSTKGGNQEEFLYINVTPSLAKVLGVQPIAGRMLTSSDSRPGAVPVMMISQNLARSRFGSSTSALGQQLTLEGKDYTVVGVLPARLIFPAGELTRNLSSEGWLPFQPEPPGLVDSPNINMYALVRPLRNLSPASLRTIFENAYQKALHRYTANAQGNIKQAGIQLHVSTLAEREFGPVLSRLQVLELAAFLLLLLVLANLMGLAATDALARRHEFATRAALGAGVRRLFWGRAREFLALGVAGWLIGIGLGWLGSRTLAATVGQAGTSAVFTAPVLLAALGAVIVIVLLLSLTGLRHLRAPGAMAADISGGTHATGGRAMARTLRALVVVQLVASLILLFTTAQLQANVFGLKHGDLGFTPAGRTFINVRLPGSEGHQTQAQYEAYVKQAFVFDQTLIARMQALPGVKAAALLSLAPFSPGDSMTTDIRSAPNAKSQIINWQAVSRDIVSALGLRTLAGNPDSIFSGSKSALLLDESAVQALWPDVHPAQAVGRDIYFGKKPWRVAAVVRPLRMRAYGSVGGTVFLPPGPDTLSGGPQRFVINSALAPQTLHSELAQMIQQINPQAKLTGYQPADQLIAQAYSDRDRLTQIFSVVALVTLVIAAVGLFALLAYRALVRRPEFAIRGALGATPARLFTYVLSEAAVLWLIGCVIGLPLAYLLSIELAGYLPKLGSIAPWLAAAVAVALGVAAVIAALVPALQASRATLAESLKQ